MFDSFPISDLLREVVTLITSTEKAPVNAQSYLLAILLPSVPFMQKEVIDLINSLTSQDPTYLFSIIEVCTTYNNYTIFSQIVSEITHYSLEFIKEFVHSDVLKKSPNLRETLLTIFNTFMYSSVSLSSLVICWMM